MALTYLLILLPALDSRYKRLLFDYDDLCKIFLYSLSQEQNSGLVQRLISQRNTLIQPGKCEE